MNESLAWRELVEHRAGLWVTQTLSRAPFQYSVGSDIGGGYFAHGLGDEERIFGTLAEAQAACDAHWHARKPQDAPRPTKACRDCRFATRVCPNDEDESWGGYHCRVSPPVGGPAQVDWYWPRVRPVDWCAKFSAPTQEVKQRFLDNE